MKMRRRDIWVYIQAGRDGRYLPEGERLLKDGRTMADRNRGKLYVLTPERPDLAMLQYYLSCGADEILNCAKAGHVSPMDISQQISALAGRYRPLAVLFAGTEEDRMIAAMTAVMSDADYHGGCDRIFAYARDGRLQYTYTSFGGALTAKYIGSHNRLQIAVLSGKQDPGISKSNRLEDAKVIIAGGRGVSGPEGFKLLQAAADELGGVVGASRVAVDKGWIGKDHLIGQSGKNVRPDLYIGCGISGSVQHLTGMRQAKHVITINTDPKALIFNVSDEAIVGDLHQVLPALVQEIRKNKKTG